jgi:hypothetical protein
MEEVLFEEKRREDALRDLGWQIVRWLWADLYRPGVIRDRVRARQETAGEVQIGIDSEVAFAHTFLDQLGLHEVLMST